MKIVFDSEDDSHVYIEVDVEKDYIPALLAGIKPSSSYVHGGLNEAIEALREIYPNDNLETILQDRVKVKYFQ